MISTTKDDSFTRNATRRAAMAKGKLLEGEV
jgi:hypothetical protein